MLRGRTDARPEPRAPAPSRSQASWPAARTRASRGLGTLIIQHLVRFACTHGVRFLLATVHLHNERILRFIEQSGVPYEKKLLDGEVWAIRADLTGLDL